MEQAFRTARYSSMNVERKAVDYLQRVASGLHRRTRRPRGRNLKHTSQRLEFAGSPRAGWHTSTRARRRQAASAHHDSWDALLAPRLEGRSDSRADAKIISIWLLLGDMRASPMANFGDSRSPSVVDRARHLVGRIEMLAKMTASSERLTWI